MDEVGVKDVAIDPADMEGEMVRSPELLARVNEQLATASRAMALADLHVDRVEALAFIDLQADPDPMTGKKRSDEKTKRELAARPEVVAAREKHVEAEARWKGLLGLSQALQRKCDMLTSIGARINAEIRANPMAAAQARGFDPATGKSP